MTSLPPIPDEAFDAAGAAYYHQRPTGEAVRAAWPHLYAAALRHVERLVAWELDNPTVPQPWRDAADALRRMADEAETP